MNEEVRFALLFGRLVDLYRANPNATDDQKVALRTLAEITGHRSLSVRLSDGNLYVEGIPIPPDTPFGSLLVQQLTAHGIAAVVVAYGAPAIEMLHLVRAIASDPTDPASGPDAGTRVRESDAVSIALITGAGARAAQERRAVRVSDAIASGGLSFGGGPSSRERQVTGARDGTTFDDIVKRTDEPPAVPVSLSASVGDLHDVGAGPQLTAQLDAVQKEIEKALREDNLSRAFEGILAVIKEEAAASSDEAKRVYGIAVRRSLTADTLRRLVPFMLDELYTEDVLQITRRAGADGTRAMLQHLAQAQSFAERKAYLAALRTIEEGTDIVASMLSHGEWYVVRNAADLVAELKIVDAVPLLGRVVDHEDERVRLSVALALAKIGTPETVRYLRAPLRDPDPKVRLAVARAIGGKGLGALSMVLVSAAEEEDDSEVLAEYYRALGRIGTPEAITALVEAAQSGKGFLARKGAPRRRAATEGLGLVGGETARAALHELASDRDREVREAAKAALER
jgi:HEAT repeat protein